MVGTMKVYQAEHTSLIRTSVHHVPEKAGYNHFTNPALQLCEDLCNHHSNDSTLKFDQKLSPVRTAQPIAAV